MPNGAELFVQAVARLGIDTIFTLVGDHLNEVLVAAARSGIRIVDMRHESGVTHAADAWGRIHRRPALSLVTGGPGHTNSLTGIATAHLAGSPLIAVSGSRPSTMAHRQAFQDIDQVGMARPVVKWAAEPPGAAQIPFDLERAYAVANTGRKGAVHLTIPVGLFTATVEQVTDLPSQDAGLVAGHVGDLPHGVIEMLRAAQRPVVIAGSGVWWSGAEEALRRFIERTSFPLYTITMARGSVSDEHPLAMGYADPALNYAVHTAHRGVRVALGPLRSHNESVRRRGRDRRAAGRSKARRRARLRIGNAVLYQCEDSRGTFAIHRMADRGEEEVKLLPIAVGLAMVGGGCMSGQDLPQWVLQLSRIKRQAKAELLRLPNFACVESINRFQSKSATGSFQPVDIIRLDVAFVDGKELVTPAGGSGAFQEMDLGKLAYGGVIGTGAFSAVARNLFVNDNGRTTGWGEERLLDRPSLRYNFAISEMQAGYTMNSSGRTATVGLEGTFWADAETLQLIRIVEHAVDIPYSLGVQDTSTSVTYARTRIGSSDVLLPRTAEILVTNTNGWRGRNTIEFTGCREYVAESVIRFDSADPVPAAPPVPPPKKK
jgi:hypothetical protein